MAASIASVNNFACRTLPKSSSKLIKNASFPPNRISFSAAAISKALKARRNFTVRAAIVGADDEPPVPRVSILKEEAPPPKEPSEIEVLKKQLFESFYGTNRGLNASSETRAEIVEFITQLEARNPNPAPTQALTLLNGKWILAYTSFLGFYPLLSREGAFSLVKVEEISQTFDSDNFTVQNSVLFSGPLATASVTTNAKFEVRSPKRVQIKFDEGVIGTPKLTDSIVLPESMEFFGQHVDLAPFNGLLSSLQESVSSVARTIAPFKFSISSSKAESWLLTTYLDHELRVSRGDGGSIFVLIKEGSPLLATY